MKTMRLTLRDRLWGSAIALSIAYLLVLQALLAGMAQGTMAAASAGRLDIICTSNGIVSHTGEGGLPGGEALRWHCATVCQLASTAAPVVLSAHTGFVYAPSRRVIATCPNPADICQSAFQALIAEARAPPFSI